MDLTFFDSLTQYFVVGAIIFLGQFVYASIGFGSGMVTISLLALLYGDVNLFVPFYLLLCIPTELVISVKDRDKIEFQQTRRFLIFIFPLLILGGYLLSASPDQWLVSCLGGVVVLLALYYLFFEDRFTVNLQRKGMVPLVGMLSGVLGGVYGISGPPLIFYFKMLKLDKRHFRVALLSIFLVMSLFRLCVYTVLHLYTVTVLVSCAACLPFSLLGLFLGGQAHHRIPELPFKRITSAVMLISGILLMGKSMISN